MTNTAKKSAESPAVSLATNAVSREGTAGNLLIVDDKPANLRLLAAMLTKQGYKVRSAISGSLALTAARAAPPELILLDINMPEMNGYEVCQQMKADEKLRDIPIIFISALDETEDKVNAFTVGGVDYITKPFQLEEVLARVRTHLSLRNLQKELQEANRKFKEELDLAGQVQASFLPARCPDMPGWECSAKLIPARETSGDFYDLIPLHRGRRGFMVADVTDKGTGAALYMALSRTLLRTYAWKYDMQPEMALRNTHQRILEDIKTNQFVTVFYGILDPASGVLIYCNAGHPSPCIFSSEKRTVRELENNGPPLGLRLFEDEVWGTGEVRMRPGDTLMLYSDGLTEARNSQGEFFGEERLKEAGRVRRKGSVRDMQESIFAALHDFVGDAPQADDITLMFLSRLAH